MGLLAAILPCLTTATAKLVDAAVGTPTVTTNGRNGRPTLHVNSGSVDKNLGTNMASVWVNIALKRSVGASQAVEIQFLDGASIQAKMSWHQTSGLLSFTGTASTVYLDISTDHVLDLYFKVGTSTGAWKVYVDGNATAALDVSSINTQATGAAQMATVRYSMPGSNDLYIEHALMMSETNTGDGMNGRLGSVVLDPMRPDGAGDQTGGTPSVGANWQCEDDTDGDSDSDNVSFSAAGGDRYTMSAAPFTTGTVKSLLICALMSKDDAGTVTARTQIKNGTTVATGATVSIASTDAYVIQAYGTDPNTAAAWTVAGLNSVLAGPERVS